MYSHEEGSRDWVMHGAMFFVGFMLMKEFLGFAVLAAFGLWMLVEPLPGILRIPIRAILVLGTIALGLIAFLWLLDY